MDFNVVLGQQVKQGDLLGHGDNTGWSTGSHLHFGMKLLNANGEVINRNNGYDGAVDPLKYLVWFGMLNNMVMVQGQKDVWLVQAGKRSLIFNNDAFQLLGGNIDFVQKLTQAQLDDIPQTGLVIQAVEQE